MLFTGRAWKIPNDLGVGFYRGLLFLNGRESTEEQTADVGQDGGTARRDTVFGQERKEFGEGVTDTLGGLEGVAAGGSLRSKR